MGNASIFKFFETRLNESIFTTKEVINGKIKNPDKVLSYIIMLPSLVIRSDLVIGTQKLFGGDSVDISFAVVHDYNQELLLVLNCHCEEGVPVDWYIVQEDDELLNRRHMKLGYKLKKIPIRINNHAKSAKVLVEELKDIRNERTPQWSNSDYYLGVVISSWAINLMYQPSNYESIAETYDGRASKDIYKLPDYTFGLEPFPSAFNLFFMKGRSEFCKILASITTNMYFYIQPFEPYNFNLIKTRTSEFFNIYKEMVEKEGIPFLIQTINIYYKNLKEKDPNIRFEKSCPKGNFIRPDDIGMDLEEFLHGVFFDINHETPLQKIDQTKILSIGIGRETKFIK
ncbi:MAG: hypothetical protein ACTSYZ_14300 [Candidatus Helarchaeota archaeon]